MGDNMSNNKNLIYHYTSFDKLKCILEYGTLRFKESTESNDMLDTKGIVNILQKMPLFKTPNNDMVSVLNFILGYYKSDVYRPRSTSMVACFSTIPDSRLLWDAYTMNRPSGVKCTYGDADKFCNVSTSKYNGACIAFRKDVLYQTIRNNEGVNCDKVYMQPIRYGESSIRVTLNSLLKEAGFKAMQLNKDDDQKQDIIPPIHIPLFTKEIVLDLKKSLVIPMQYFLSTVDAFSPFFKHEFWKEEKEIRASLYVNNANIPTYTNIKEFDSAKYCDISITSDCIDHIILGPEFDDDSFKDISKIPNPKLSLPEIKTISSIGTGVIRAK